MLTPTILHFTGKTPQLLPEHIAQLEPLVNHISQWPDHRIQILFPYGANGNFHIVDRLIAIQAYFKNQLHLADDFFSETMIEIEGLDETTIELRAGSISELNEAFQDFLKRIP